MKDVMIDIETEGTGPRATVVAIGAVFFDLASDQTGREFYAKIDPRSARLHGETDLSTVEWWGRQPEAARLEAFSGTLSSHFVAMAFDSFLCATPGCLPWGNGATFDITILEHLFREHNIWPPWKYYNVRDVRTLVDLGGRIAGSRAKQAPFNGMAHKALDDARHQVKYCQAIYQELKR